MDHAQRAREQLGIAEDVSPDHINDCAAEAQISALTAIGHALLDVAGAIREQTAEIHAQTGAMLNEGIVVHEGGLER